MWISRRAFDTLIEEHRLSRALRTRTDQLLQDARDENKALRKELEATRAAIEADRTALREAAVALHGHVTADGHEAVQVAQRVAAEAMRTREADARERALLEARVAVADVNFGWCRQLVNQLQATQAALLGQRGISVPQVAFAAPAPTTGPAMPAATGSGTPGAFDDSLDGLADAMGVSFDDVGDEAARRLKLEHADVSLDVL